MGRQNPHSQESISLHLCKLLIVSFSLISGLSRALSFLLVFLPNERTKPQLQLELWRLVTYEKDYDQCWSQAPSPVWGTLGRVGRFFLLCQQLSPLVPTLHHSLSLDHLSPCCCSKCQCWVPTSVSPHGCPADPSTRSIGIPDTHLISVFRKLTWSS